MLFSQNIEVRYLNIQGSVVDEHDKPVPFASVFLEGTNYGTESDETGQFSLSPIPAEDYILWVSSTGFEKKSLAISNASGIINIKVNLREDVMVLQEALVEGLAIHNEKKNSAENVTFLEAKTFENTSLSTASFIDAASGVRVRQQGGLGSNANISINGISGKQIKFFIDGIPLEGYGQGMNINIIPINLIQRMEIHKGYIPIDFGGDAIGGIINLITKDVRTSYIDASYSIGSFNSHSANLNTRYVTSGGLYAGFLGFYNHSDNNYKVDVPVTNASGNPEIRTVRRFHDAFSNHFLQLEAGAFNKRWADEISLKVIASGFSSEIQHGSTMATPFGQAKVEEFTRGASFTFKKYNLLKNLDLHLFSMYNQFNRDFTDTARSIYNWHGEVVRRRSLYGETSYSGNLLHLNSNLFFNRLFLNYHIKENILLKYSIIGSVLSRQGRDPVSALFYKKDIFANPTHLNKVISAAALEQNFFNDRLASISSVKHFSYTSMGSNLAVEAEAIENRTSRFGYGQAFRYKIFKRLLAKASYENTTRIPDELELFGEGNMVLPNPELTPEQSHNFNLGLLYHPAKAASFTAETNIFLRNVENIIYQRLINTVSTQFQNLYSAQIAGIEGELAYTPFKFISLKANLTYQSIRNKSRGEDALLSERYYNARLPHTPYLFGYSEVRLNKTKIFKQNDQLDLWWNLNYVHWFYLNWDINGRKDTKFIVPTQSIHSVGISYHIIKDGLVASFDINNLWDQKAFDFFSVQRPGRFYAFKLRTFINQF